MPLDLHEDPDWWKEEPEIVPPLIIHGFKMEPEKEYVEYLAGELLKGKSDLSRANIEAYMAVRHDRVKAINFLHTLLEADDMEELYPHEKGIESSLPPLTAEERAERYTWSVRDLEELFHLEMWAKAVELLRSRGQ